jgi:pimeloyl-ACP methyl ester carboxylesterase
MRILAMVVMLAFVAGCRSTGGGNPSAGPGPGAAGPPAAISGGPVDGTVPSKDGVMIHYHSEGSGLPAVVLIHGWACDGSIWDAQVKALAPRYTVVTIDLAGHGQSGRNRADWTIAAFAEDIRAVIEKLQLKRVVVVGHSMSGYVILELARLMPDRVVALIPVDTLQDVEWKPGEGFEDWIESMSADFVPFTREFVMSMFPETADPALVERMASRMSAMPPDIGVAVLRAVFAYDKAATLALVKQPIRAINSDMLPTLLDVSRRYAPQFEAVFVSGTGHFPMLEKPAEFNRLLEQAIEDLTR